MNQAVYKLLESSLAPATKASYKNAMNHYKTFHHTYNGTSPLLPVSAEHLAQFVAVCHYRKLKASTITSYISAISYIHKLLDMVNPADSFLIKKLLHSVRRYKNPDKRRPFTLNNLQDMMSALKSTVSDHVTRLCMRAMFLMAFFGLFRVGEIAHSPTGHRNVITRNDIDFNYTGSKISSLSITLRHFKHSQGQTAVIPLSRQSVKTLCPVRALIHYLKAIPYSTGPMFVDFTGQPITTTAFRSTLRSCVIACHLDPLLFTAHSFRIGGATHAHQSNMSAQNIQKLGRWKSSAYLKYIRPQPLPV